MLDQPTRFVQPFEDGHAADRTLLGGKGANLAEMTRLGLPVPPGFTVTTEACRAYFTEGEKLPQGLEDQLMQAVGVLEQRTGRRLGDPDRPLLVSVRSGAAFSMPGMMDTILNLGLNRDTVQTLATETGDERFAWDAFRRLVQLFGVVVLGVPGEAMAEEVARAVEAAGGDERGIDAAGWRELTGTLLSLITEHSPLGFPEDPREQLVMAVGAVFRSWNGRRARDYRRMEGIPDDLGTAVNVQAMVFGNLGSDSGTGVAFTRDPATGARTPYGDWLPLAQGEDVVAGLRITRPLSALDEDFPGCARQLREVLGTLEQHFADMCDVEFTIERGTLYMLQTRVGKRSAIAAVRMAVEMAQEGMISRAEALRRVSPAQVERLLHPSFDPAATYDVLTTGLGASPGAAHGQVCLTADEAVRRASEGHDVVLVRRETSPDDLHGMIAARGILTSRGGLVSHAAVVARGMGRPAVCGADAVTIDLEAGTFTVGDTTVSAGEEIAIDGTTGEVVLGAVPVVIPRAEQALETLLGWADDASRLLVLANADLPEDARRARELGAVGIGLCRTEHMFLGDRLGHMQRVILAGSADERVAALEDLRVLQRQDFIGILQAMDGLPVTVRLLDPPLHEFLPDLVELTVADATDGLDAEGSAMLAAAEHWEEDNPMLGTRGVRLGILIPELYRMQVRALMQAAAAVARTGGHPQVEVMVPLVAAVGELDLVADWIREEADATLAAEGVTLDYQVGVMIETPRAALTAGALAGSAEFFSFGTNDLTQMTFGFSRDDVEGRIMPTYEGLGIMVDPFGILDAEGVGRLMRLAVAEGRAARPGIRIGICGEHGGDPASIAVCDQVGVDYVSCSPYRVPVARLAAAHSALGASGGDASV